MRHSAASPRSSSAGLAVRIAAKCAVPSSRPEWTSALWLVAAGFMIVVSLYSVGSIVISLGDRQDVLKAREPARASTAGGTRVDLNSWSTTSGEMIVYRLGPRQSGLVLPPGLTRWPGEGEAVASPALIRTMPSDPYLTALAQGKVVGVVGNSGLRDPDELLIYLGMSDSAMKSINAPQVSGFGTSQVSLEDMSPAQVRYTAGVSFLLAGFGVIALLLVVTRLAVVARERRLAVLMLLGATSTTVRRVAGVTAGLLLMIGALVGTLAAGPVSDALARLGMFGTRWWSQGSPPVGVGAVLVGCVGLLGGYLCARQTDIDPWRIRRRAPERQLSVLRLAPVVAGSIALGGVLIAQSRYAAAGTATPTSTFLILLGAVVAILVGLMLSAPLLVGITERALSRSLLVLRVAGARAGHHAQVTSRLTVALVTLMIALGVCIGVVAAAVSKTDTDAQESTSLQLPGPDEVGGALPTDALTAALNAPGVTRVEVDRSDGLVESLERAEQARPDDTMYQVTVEPSRINVAAAAIAKPWRYPPDVIMGNPAADRIAGLLGGTILIAMVICGTLLLGATALAMIAIQTQRHYADHALMATGMSRFKLASIRAAEIVLATFPVPMLGAASAIAIAIATMRIDDTALAIPWVPVLVIAAAPAVIAAPLAAIAFTTSPTADSIELRPS